MGWHKCSKCGSKDWMYHSVEDGCNICNPNIEDKWKKDIEEFFERNKDENLEAGISVN